ncbi:hypothetical protein CDAR_73401 [Caerostris darwini]|uniref:Uncharacterized protein n=1 Tax=Caerostris darwini TaxID=1538125 RepID=A0AAV4VLT9_9ARAC|nr:hypothetical protein CDAR_73401 [Caerostris darwini]
MASQVNDFTVTWRIENYHLRFHRSNYCLESVEYLMETMERTKWTLRLNPCHEKDKASLWFKRSREDDGPDALTLNYEFSFIQPDGSWTYLERPFRNNLNNPVIDNLPNYDLQNLRNRKRPRAIATYQFDQYVNAKRIRLDPG